MKRLAFAFLLIALGACAPQTVAPSEPQAPPPFAARTSAILADREALALSHQCSRTSPGPVGGQWTPTAADVAALEPRLGSVLRTHLTADNVSADVRDYYRQYAGFVIGGRRQIYVNGVHRSAVERDPDPSHPFDWHTQAIGICDGGSVTFGVIYDPAVQEFTQFAFNGAPGLR